MSSFLLYTVNKEGPERILVPDNFKSPTDIYRGLKLGVYTSLRTFEHDKFLHLADHLQRTRYSMAELGWSYSFDEQRLRAALDQVVNDYPYEEAQVRIDILAEPAYELGIYNRILITLVPLTPVPDAYYLEGVGIDFAAGLIRARPKVKTADFAQDRQRFLPKRDQKHYEYLIVNEEQQILEGTMTNFWAARDGVVYTPGEKVLEGITRKIILGLLDDLRIPVKLQAITVADIPRLDEAAVSGSSRAIVPVIRIAKYTVGEGRPGPLFARILGAYRAYVRAAIKPAVP